MNILDTDLLCSEPDHGFQSHLHRSLVQQLCGAARYGFYPLHYECVLIDVAFCRVFRIGQKSETWITRFIVKRSADEKLLEMQLKKNALISAAMDDKNVMSQLTVEEVMRLFGEVRFDKNKKPFIAMDANEKLDSILK